MKHVLFVLSEYGYWGEELIGPKETLENAGYNLDFATPNGKRPHALLPSADASYIDPPSGKPEVSEEIAAKIRTLEESDTLDHPLSLRDLFPLNRPHMSSPDYLYDFENYNRNIEKAASFCERYDALILIGGSESVADLVHNDRVHDLIHIFYEADLPIAAECYSVACLASARNYWLRKSPLWGKHITGHPPELILQDAVGPDGVFHGNVCKTISVVVDYPFITSRSASDSYKTGKLLVHVLQNRLKRYGW